MDSILNEYNIFAIVNWCDYCKLGESVIWYLTQYDHYFFSLQNHQAWRE
jgi:hypothetical protein